MDWVQFSLFAIGVVGLFFWNRAESRADMRAINNTLEGMAKETKDFHGRLCTLEERYIQLMQKMWEERR